MDLRLAPEQEQLVDSFAAMFERHSTPDQVRAAEPLGFDPSLWDRLLELGIVAMAVGEEAGGWGASTLDLALVAEQVGRSVAPAPVVEAQVAARLLERLDGPAASAALAAALDGRVTTLALHPVRRGSARLVPAGAVAGAVIASTGDALVLVEPGQARPVENLGSMPLADIPVPGAPMVLAEGAPARQAFDAALDDWCTLTAAALFGLAQRALEIGVEYVKERHAWGVPIGSFQSIAHRLADAATANDAAQLVARKAAWSAEHEPARHGELAAMAFALAQEAARDTTYRSLHYHGGYGFMMEYDIQLYFRRARAWSQVLGGPSVIERRIADKRYGPVVAVS